MAFSTASLQSLRPWTYHVAAALFFSIVGVVFYLPFLSELPTGIHTWAQSDRLSLAMNFYDYGFHFFTPRTYSLDSIGGITGVEFPLQPYLAALGGAVFGRGSIVTIFRLLDVVALLVGFYYLFRLVYERTGHFVAGLVPGAFLLASPFLAFYAGSFMPEPFSLSLSFVAYYYWVRFFDTRHFPDLRVAVLLLGLASLVKTTTVLHLGAVSGITLLWIFLQPERFTLRQRLAFLGLLGGILGVIGFFFVYNQSLNETYQSGQFLAAARPIVDPEGFHDVVYYINRNWIREYATIPQYRILAVCVVLLVVYLWRNVRLYLPLVLLLGAALVLSYLFFQLMGMQLGTHDYYLISIAVPIAALLLVLALLNLGHYTGIIRYVTSAGLAVLMVFMLADGYKRLNRRMSDDYPPFSPYGHVWMRGGAAEMTQAGVPTAARILVFNEIAPNISLVYFDRRGLVWRPGSVDGVTADDFVLRMAADSLDYLIIEPGLYTQLAPQHAAIATEFETVGKSPAIVLRRRNRLQSW